MPRRMWRLIANPLGRLAPRREIAFSLVLGTDDFGALPRINWNRWIQTGKFCNIGDTRSRTDFQFPRCRTIKLQSANTISTAAPRENEYSKVASLKSKCQSALRRRRTEEGGLVVGGGERERERVREGKGNKMKKIFDPVASSMSLHDDHEYGYLTIFEERFEMCNRCLPDKWILRTFHCLGINCESERKKKRKKIRDAKITFCLFFFFVSNLEELNVFCKWNIQYFLGEIIAWNRFVNRLKFYSSIKQFDTWIKQLDFFQFLKDS